MLHSSENKDAVVVQSEIIESFKKIKNLSKILKMTPDNFGFPKSPTSDFENFSR